MIKAVSILSFPDLDWRCCVLAQWGGALSSWATPAMRIWSPGGAAGRTARNGGAPGTRSPTRSTASDTWTGDAIVQESMWKASLAMPRKPCPRWRRLLLWQAPELLPLASLSISTSSRRRAMPRVRLILALCNITGIILCCTYAPNALTRMNMSSLVLASQICFCQTGAKLNVYLLSPTFF
jgi:hypothetical protein